MSSYTIFIRAEPGELVNEIISSNFPRFYRVKVEYVVLDMIEISGLPEVVFVVYGSQKQIKPRILNSTTHLMEFLSTPHNSPLHMCN